MTKKSYKPKTSSLLTNTITAKQIEKSIAKNNLHNSYNTQSDRVKITPRAKQKYWAKVSDRNELIKNIIKDSEQKILSERAEQEQKNAELAALSTNSDNTNNQELSGTVSLKCEEESLDDWF